MASPNKTPCKFGSKCYRKNPDHLKKFSHPSDDKLDNEPPNKKQKINDFFKPKASAKRECEDGEVEASPSKSDDSKESTEIEDHETPVDPEPEEDEGPAPDSPSDVKENIKSKFLVEMPQDFYDFWDFAKSMNSSKPTDAFNKTLGLKLVGPFDVLAGKTKKKNGKGRRPCYLRHWRYYYDPPEFMTVIKGDDKSQFHMGYFRDDPQEMPSFVASNPAKDSCIISPRGENLFAALHWFIEDRIKKEGKLSELVKLKDLVKSCAEKGNYPLELKTKNMKARDKKVVTKSFHHAGIVVPVDENEIGYRELPETPADLKKMLKKIAESKTQEERDKNFDPLMEIIMLVQFANDECDYGEGLELGLDLFSYGGETFHQTIKNLLPLAYQLLGRHEYKNIIEAHLKDRKHSADLDELA